MSTVDKLAILGGEKAIPQQFALYNPIGSEEVAAAAAVVESGVLSQFIGRGGTDFLGGPKVREFEQAMSEYFDVEHAISVNSWTSGLIASVGALDIEPGDEIIVTPWTMCASATAILIWNAIPVFADIDPQTFCLDPKSVEDNITPHTRAIMSVDIGGHPANTDALNAIAKKHGLKVISDTAQAPGATLRDKFAGTLTDLGGYSLNYHKHIHTGEGGVVVTNDSNLAERVRLIRNHGEHVAHDIGLSQINNIIGFNFRLGEIESAIGIAQLKKLDKFVATRRRAAERLTQGLKDLAGLETPFVAPDCTHSYYMYFMKVDPEITGVSRNDIHKALVAEGVPGLGTSYANIHLLPMYQQKIAYGKAGFPWKSDICRREVSYAKGICPVAEDLQDRTYLGFQMCMHEMTDAEVDAMVQAFHKVWRNMHLLPQLDGQNVKAS
ncbi:aminotransferase DegT [Thalassospira tepidiphila]|jgi:dTDP-4-amino-4,6-dideoxygalactose transaminase|uniref:DegT/DnrJ/EryC1/StrS family aminotransferase n=1 Tax=Thalassospira tepidiphila TaxID=393657 RepID=UPI0029251F70|nr:aminotransferase DegT [Thalassospira tepidiphila]